MNLTKDQLEEVKSLLIIATTDFVLLKDGIWVVDADDQDSIDSVNDSIDTVLQVAKILNIDLPEEEDLVHMFMNRD